MLIRRAAALVAAVFLAVSCSATAASDSSHEFMTPPRTVTVTTKVTASPSVTATPSVTVSTSELAMTSTEPVTRISTPAVPGTSITTATPTTDAPPVPEGLAVTDADRTRAATIVDGLSLADRAASVLMVTGSAAIGTGLLRDHPFGGVILFAPGRVVDGTASGTPSEVRAVTKQLRRDAATDPTGLAPLIATDQEYGLVQRLTNGFTSFPDAETYGRIGDRHRAASLARRAAAAAAREMRAVGVTVNFAPVFGVTPADGSASAIGQYGRSYGSDPQHVARLVAAVVEGYQAGGVVAVMKHFPGLARIAADSHVTLPTFPFGCRSWNAHEAIPARAGIDAGVTMVMTGHVLMPKLDSEPASLSRTIIGTLLRGDGARGCDGLGFTGVTVTDSLQMQPITARFDAAAAAVTALNAGEDLLLMSANPVAAAAGIVAAVRDGSLGEQRLNDAATAVLAVRIAAERVPTPKLKVVGSAKHRALAAEIRAEG